MKRFKQFIYEASLAGATTFHKRKTGAFYQYVVAKPDIKSYVLEKETMPLLIDGTPFGKKLKKGTSLEIIERDKEEDVKVIGRSLYAVCKIKGEEQTLLIALNAILKPTGKNVEEMKVDLTSKKNPSIFEPFKGGHGHEGMFTEAWIKNSGENWQFEYKGKMYRITRLSAPRWKGQGNPKTDVTVVLDKPLFGSKFLKYSLKADNATYFENWMLPSRFQQIFGRDSKKILERTLEELNRTGKIKGTKTNTHTICPFIKKPKYNSETVSAKQMIEVISGEEKFNKGEGAANVFFGGKVDANTSIEEILNRTFTAKDMSRKIKAGLDFRGSSDLKNSSCFIKGENSWYVNPKGWGDMVDKKYTIST